MNRRSAINVNCTANLVNHIVNKKPVLNQDISDMLLSSLVWGHTPQGSDYWHRLYLNPPKDLMEIVPALIEVLECENQPVMLNKLLELDIPQNKQRKEYDSLFI